MPHVMTREEIKAAFIKACEAAHNNGWKIAPTQFGITARNGYWVRLPDSSMCLFGALLMNEQCSDFDPVVAVTHVVPLSVSEAWSVLDGFDDNEATSGKYYSLGKEIREELIAKGIMNGKGLSYLR